jgi:hypothetical protein
MRASNYHDISSHGRPKTLRMNETIILRLENNEAIEGWLSGRKIFRYVFRSQTPEDESPRPYFHPLCNRHGDCLTNFRPHDHRWHHGLSLTLTRVNTTNFWGGPTYRKGRGYAMETNHGTQRHTGFAWIRENGFEERLEWLDPKRENLLTEMRFIFVEACEGGWNLCWRSSLTNVMASPLTLGNYHSSEGLTGSHYTGLQFRGARELLYESKDEDITGDGGLIGEAAIHGQPGRWVEWRCRHDGSLHRTRVRFESLNSPSWLFVRRASPQAVLAIQRERDIELPANAVLALEYRVTIRDEPP